jgi:hypothetical protein
MIPIYHDIVGRGMVMELAFSVDRNGLVDPKHEKVYKQIGQWVKDCYGTPVASTSGSGNQLILSIPKGKHFDRIMVQEDIVMGQRIRQCEIYIKETTENGTYYQKKLLTSPGQAVRRKRIHLLPSVYYVKDADQNIMFSIHDSIAPPQIKNFGVYAPCYTGLDDSSAIKTTEVKPL